MKKLFATLFALIAPMWVFGATELPIVQNVYARQPMLLNGRWNYIVDQQEIGYYDYRMNPMRHTWGDNAKAQRPSDLVEYNFDVSPAMKIPTDWNTADDQLFFYEGTVWFKRSFNYTKKADRRAILYFGAVNYEAIVYVNGHRVGKHIGGFTPFNFDVTDELRDGENVVVVKVDNKRHRDNVPTQIFDWWNYGGITRDVLLFEVGDTFVDDYVVQLAKGNQRLIDLQVRLNKAVESQQIVVNIPELKLSQTLVTDANGQATAQVKARPTLWSPENPKLYEVEITMNGQQLTDEIGFRTIETRGKQILLNGKPIFLRGISIHEEAPFRQGRAHTTEDAHILLSWAKELGCNYVRLAHYPHNELAVREAERMGIMVWSEIPVYWTISWQNEGTFNNAQQQLHDMIRRDHNRAAIIIWSIANETPHSDARDQFLGKLAEYARTQDNTRLISMAMEVTGASNYVNRLKDNMNKYVDVVSFNEYVGWYRDVHDAPRMTWEVPYEKPVIISEWGGGALAGYHGSKEQRWTEEFQENLYRENIAMLEKIDGLAGMSPWILKDFLSPRRPLFGVQDWFNRKGVVSDKGEKKLAFYVLRDWYTRMKEKYEHNIK